MNPLDSAKWIENTRCPRYAAPVFKKDFTLDRPIGSAEFFISGLGFYHLTVNGQLASDDLLQPAFSKYDVTVYYNRYELKSLLHNGTNTLEITLGNGWFNEPGDDCFDFEHAVWKIRPTLLCELIVDGKLVLCSDSSWLCDQSRITYNSVRFGEDVDFTLPPPAFAHHATVSKGPGGILKEQKIPPIRVQRVFEPISEKNGVYDFGISTAGDVELTLSGALGETVEIQYGERMDESGNIDPTMIKRHPTIPRNQMDRLVMNGELLTYHPTFSYRGFRYVQIRGNCTVHAIHARTYHTNLAEKGGFDCSNPTLNGIMSACKNSTLTNFHHIPTDCPHREKNGWTGDAHLSSEQALWNFDMEQAYIKYINDLADCQLPTGQLPCIAPTSVYGFNFQSGPTWDAALILIPWNLYWFTGKMEYLSRWYEAGKLYLDYTRKISEGGLCESGLGDFLPMEGETVCPDGMLLSCYVAHLAEIMGKSAAILGRSEDSNAFSLRAVEVKEAIKARYIGQCPPSQSYFAVGLKFGLFDDPAKAAAELNKLVIEREHHVNGGIFSSVFTLEMLTEYGYFDTALQTVTNPEAPGWAHMLSDHTNALWEHWLGKQGSLNHHMRSGVGAWMYTALGGIRMDQPGFARVTIQPRFHDSIQTLSLWHDTPHGRLAVSYDENSMTVQLPPDTVAEVILPDQTIIITQSEVFKRK